MAQMEIKYSYLESMVSSANSLVSQLNTYVDGLQQSVYNQFSGVTDGGSTNLDDAKYYVNKKIEALKEKSKVYSNLSVEISTLASDAKEIDAGVATHISDCYDEFIGDHSDLKIDDWKASIIEGLSWLKDKIPALELVSSWNEDIGNFFTDKMKEIKHWYKCEGGKEIVGVALSIVGAIVAVALAIATFPVSGIFEFCAAVSAVIGAMNAVVNVGTSVASLRAKRNGDPAWASIYGGTDTAADFLRLKRSDNKAVNYITNWGGTLLDIAEVVTSVVAVGGSLKELGMFSNFSSYFKEARWGKNGKMVLVKGREAEGVVKTKVSFKSFIRGVKSYKADATIDGVSEEGIRTIFKNNLKSDFTNIMKRKFSKENGTIVNLLFGDENKRMRVLASIKGDFKLNYTFTSDIRGIDKNCSKFVKLMRANKGTLTNYKNIIGNLDKISNGKFNVKEYAGRKTFSYLNSYQGAALDGNLIRNSENVKKSFTTFLDNLKTGIGWAL